jgi:hypothetical protein
MIYRVPVDDYSTLLYFLRFYPMDRIQRPLFRLHGARACRSSAPQSQSWRGSEAPRRRATIRDSGGGSHTGRTASAAIGMVLS